MEAVFISAQQRQFTLRGICPHCNRDSAFLLITSVAIQDQATRWIAGMQCQACMNNILGIAFYNQNSGAFHYVAHYPLGKPDDNVADEVPDHIKPDFKEALRCLWVDAYNATAEMCRRAVEASCLDLGAKGRVLDDLIDSLAAQQKITPFLQQVAHKIRLGRNRGAHPASAVPAAGGPGSGPPPLATVPQPAPAPITTIEKDHAEAIVKFTREFFHHVYVLPKQLDKYDFSKRKAAKS
jgi:hypothetical protein